MGKGEFALDGLEGLVQEFAAFAEGLVERGFAVKEEDVKGEDANFDFNVFCFGVFAFSGH